MTASLELKIEALYDCWAFAELINFKGGTKSFEECHFDFILVLSAPQLWEAGRLTKELARRWARACDKENENYLITADGRVERPPVNRLLQMPRGHWKSTLMILYIMWRIYRNANIRILNATNIKDLSEAFIRELRSYFEDEDLRINVWDSRPHIPGPLIPPLDKAARRYYGGETEADDRKIVWSNRQLQMQRSSKMKEPTIFSTSVKSKVTGQHFDIIIMDDVVDYDNSSSLAKIRTVQRWAADIASIRNIVTEKSLFGVLPDGTRLYETLGNEYVVTGTHYDPNDYYVFIKRNASDLGFSILNRNIYKNGVDSCDGYLWSRFTEKEERRLRAELADTPGVFDAQYLNSVDSPDLQVLTTTTIQYLDYQKLLDNRTVGGAVTFINGRGELDDFEPIMAIDFAISLSSRADFSAIAVGGMSGQGSLVACDFSVGHYSVEKVISEAIKLVQRWNIKRMFVETIGFQALYRREIIRCMNEQGIRCAVVDYVPHGNKQKRIEASLGKHFETGTIYFGSQIKSQIHTMNTFKFFGRASAKDDPPDALSVVAEKSIHQARTTQQRRTNRVVSDFSTRTSLRYGGIY